MCAAPGSKTAQLIELLHAEDTPTSSIPSRHYIIPHDPGIVLPALDSSSNPGPRESKRKKRKPLLFFYFASAGKAWFEAR